MTCALDPATTERIAPADHRIDQIGAAYGGMASWYDGRSRAIEESAEVRLKDMQESIHALSLALEEEKRDRNVSEEQWGSRRRPPHEGRHSPAPAFCVPPAPASVRRGACYRLRPVCKRESP